MRLLTCLITMLFSVSVAFANEPERRIALTFDDGPDPSSTPKILELLERHNAKATFFLIGSKAAEFPEVVRRIADAGHDLGNHSYSHQNLTTLRFWAVVREITDCNEALSRVNKARCFYYRPPYGYQTFSTRVAAFVAGQMVIGWSSTSNDWRSNDADEILRSIVLGVRPGSVILLHDSLAEGNLPRGESVGRAALFQALDIFLETNKSKYEFKTISEMRASGSANFIWWSRKQEIQ